MNKISEIHDLDKGKPAEIQGQVTYSMEPRQYGKYITQFVVVEDETGKIGCNISLGSKEDKLENGNNVHIEGVVDKYPDKKNPLPDGSFPIATSVKGRVMEHYTKADEFPYGANVGKSYTDEVEDLPGGAGDVTTKKSVGNVVKPTLPAKSERKPVELKNPPKAVYTNSKDEYWNNKLKFDIESMEMRKANNKLIVRECAIKAATEITSTQIGQGEVLAVDGYLKLADIIVDWVNTNKEIEEKITEKDLILSGAKTKAEIIAYINNARVGTPYERDDEFYTNLNCQILTHQTKPELIRTVEEFDKLLGGK